MRVLLGIGVLGAAAIAGQSFSSFDFVSNETKTPPPAQQVVAAELTANIPAATNGATLPGSESAHLAGLTALTDALRKSQAAAAAIPSYTAVIEQQVYVGTRLHDAEKMELKFRRAPFSVYLRWPHDDQQALYVDGQNDNRLIVRPTRGLASLRGVWRLRPDSAQAMQDSRYPITAMGIEKLCEMILAYHAGPEAGHQGMACKQITGTLNGREVDIHEVQFASPKICPTYAKAIMQFDKETHLLISAEHHRWGENNVPELLERYVYQDIKPAELKDEDFSQANESYSFR